MRKALVFAILVATALGDDAQTALDALQKEFDAAVLTFRRNVAGVGEPGQAERDHVQKLRSDFGPRFAAFAEKHAGTDAAAAALGVVAKVHLDAVVRGQAARTLMRDHPKSPQLKYAVHELNPDELRALAEKGPDADVRSEALLRLAEIHVAAGESKEAVALYREIGAKYGDLPWADGTLMQRAEACVFEILVQGVGREAPEIDGEDLDGKPMKLSDFRGKVIVLDFWGDW